MDHDGDNEEEPPFALSETVLSQVFCLERTDTHSSSSECHPQTSTFQQTSPVQAPVKTGMTSWKTSSSTGLTESVMTETSSSGSDSSQVHEVLHASRMGASSSLLSSLPSITSSTATNSRCLQDSELSSPQHGAHSEHEQPENTNTFSQLMREIDADVIPLAKSRMPVVPENGPMEMSSSGGTLISSPKILPESEPVSNRTPTRIRWAPPGVTGPVSRSGGLSEPLLDHGVSEEEPNLVAPPSQAELERARTRIQAALDSDDSFGVTMDLPSRCTVENALDVVANPEFLWMWCDPIHSLVVTSTSDDPASSGSDHSLTTGQNARVYEGRWIEATTTALEAPPHGMRPVYRAGQTLLDALGFASYGKITMFVERGGGHVGLTIGPFSSGIYATHHIRIYESDGRARMSDRVRLSRNLEGASCVYVMLSGILDTCMLTSCVLPSTKAYMEQVSTSMARLRILVENVESSREAVRSS